MTEGKPDYYSELADALGCDQMDSHSDRLAQARKCADALVHVARDRAALVELQKMMGPEGRERFVMLGPRMFQAVLNVVNAALK